MKRILALLFFVCAMALPMIPMDGTAQEFGLEEGDDVGFILPGEAAAAEATGGESPGSALVLAAPDRVGVGQPFLVRLTSDQPLDSVSIHWQGKQVEPSISVWNDRHVALAMLGADVLDAKPGKAELTVTASIDGRDNAFRRTVQLTPVDYPRQELTLPKKMVTPPQEVYDRIKQDRAATSKAKATVTPQRTWRLPLVRPVSGSVSSVYGAQRILNGIPKNPHRGMDFRSPMGNPAKSVADGTVILVGDHYYAGKSVYVDHGNGVVSMYFHLSEFTVEEGDAVKAGQPVGLTGMSGRSTGPHLHFSISVLGELVDPAPLFKMTVDNMLKQNGVD